MGHEAVNCEFRVSPTSQARLMNELFEIRTPFFDRIKVLASIAFDLARFGSGAPSGDGNHLNYLTFPQLTDKVIGPLDEEHLDVGFLTLECTPREREDTDATPASANEASDKALKMFNDARDHELPFPIACLAS